MIHKKRCALKAVFPILGIGSLMWFLARVIPKPSRAAYPCMRVAAPVASTFVLWLLGIGTSYLFLKKACAYIRRLRFFMAAAAIAAGGITGGILISMPHSSAHAAVTPNAPIGVAKGANPGRVVWVHDSSVSDWTGVGDGHWWLNNHTKQAIVDQMMSQTLCALSGKTNDTAAWDTLFRYFNSTHGHGSQGYATGEKIAIKINLTYCSHNAAWCIVDTSTYSLTHYLDYMHTSPQVVRSLLRELVNVVGVNQSDISVGDPSAYYPNEYFDSCYAEFPNVHYIDYGGKFGRTKVTFSDTPFYWSCRPTGVTMDYVPLHYVQATYVINLANMKSHLGAGITACAKNNYGSLIRLPSDSGYYSLHQSLAYVDSAMGSYRAVVDLMGHAQLGGKTLLYLVDGLYEGNHNNDTVPHRWSTTPFNGGWTSSLFASQDPVAIESVLFDLMQLDYNDAYQYPKIAGAEDYMIEAAEANNPPSLTFYDPNHATATTRLASLGVHEHWNDTVHRQYSRNLGTGNGIELVFIEGATSAIRTGNPAVVRHAAYSLRALTNSSVVEFSIPTSEAIKLKLFDSRGRSVGTVLDAVMGAGSHRVNLNSPATMNKNLPAGAYILALYGKGIGVSKPAASCTVELVRK